MTCGTHEHTDDTSDTARAAPATRARAPKGAAWWHPVAAAALLGALGWVALQLLDHERTKVEHGARLRTLESQYQSIDAKLDRLIERR